MIASGENTEEELAQHVRRLENQCVGKQGIYLQLSTVSGDNRRQYHTRIAAHCFADLVSEFQGSLFVCNNSDMIFIGRGVQAEKAQELTYKLTYLFAGDPLLVNAEGSHQFCNWYDLSSQWEELHTLTDRLLTEKRVEEADLSNDPFTDEDDHILDTQRLDRLEAGLSSIDISSFIRRQPICLLRMPDELGPAYRPDVQPVADPRLKPVVNELYVRISEMQSVTMPGVDLLANRWLFQHLTVVLDQRVLALLMKDFDILLRRPVALNLNLETILSEEFTRFAFMLSQAEREKTTIELQPVDVMADLGAYLFARTYLRESGFKITLDGTDRLTFPELARANLEFDHIKLRWDDGLNAGGDTEQIEKLHESINVVGAKNIILCHCSSAAALDRGNDLGIKLFQGRHIDFLLNPKARRIN